MNKRKLRSIIRSVLNESRDIPMEMYDTNFIPAGTLEDILAIDGHQEFTEELATYCEMLETGDEPYFIMENAVYKFIMGAMYDLANDPGEWQQEFRGWYQDSKFDNVRIEMTAKAVNAGMAGASFVKWSMS